MRDKKDSSFTGYASGVTAVYAKWMRREPLVDGLFMSHPDCTQGGGSQKCYDPSRVIVVSACAMIFACWLTSAISSRIPMYRNLKWSARFVWCWTMVGLMNGLYMTTVSAKALIVRPVFAVNGTEEVDLGRRVQELETVAAYALGVQVFEVGVWAVGAATALWTNDLSDIHLKLVFVVATVVSLTNGCLDFVVVGLMLCEVSTPIQKIVYLAQASGASGGHIVQGVLDMTLSFALISRGAAFGWLASQMYKSWERVYALPQEAQSGLAIVVALCTLLVPAWLKELRTVAERLGQDTVTGRAPLATDKKTN